MNLAESQGWKSCKVLDYGASEQVNQIPVCSIRIGVLKECKKKAGEILHQVPKTS